MKRKSTAMDKVLPTEITEALLEATAPVQLAPDRQANLRDRILKKARQTKPAPARDFLTIAKDQGEWIKLTPLAELKILLTDKDASSYLIRLHPGAVLPAHDHPQDEECLCLEGECWVGDQHLRTGDFHLAPKGMRHEASGSDTGALLFIRGALPEGIM